MSLVLAVGKRVRWALPEPPAQLRILSALYPDELSKLAVGNIVHWAYILDFDNLSHFISVRSWIVAVGNFV